MTLLVPWLAFPLVLGLLSLGCGLLLQRAAGLSLPGPLLVPAGLALVVVAALFPPVTGATAELATPLVVALAAAGYALSLPFHRPRLNAWPVAAAASVYALFAAPVVLSGRATFAGYIKLDDTATYLAMLDRFLGHGDDLSRLAPSTYEATLATSLAYGYPMGSLAPLGVGHTLLREDAAWLWQPYLACLAAALAFAVYALVSPLVFSPPMRALAAFGASSSALLYGYALWGGIKELAAAYLLTLVAALIPVALRAGLGPRSLLPLAVGGAATLGVLSAAGAVWLLPLLAAVVFLAARRRGLERAFVSGGVLTLMTAALAIPALDAAATWLGHSDAFTSGDELGNLYRPLDWVQVFGVWPVGDFRRSPDSSWATAVLISIVVCAAAAGVVLAWLRRAWGVLSYAAAIAIGALVFVAAGSPWIGAKALATASPAALALGLAACGALVRRRGLWIGGALAAAAIVGGVMWSNLLAYHDVLLAPRARLAELETIGREFAGQGPALMTEYEPYGARHFLRRVDPEGASELRRRFVYLRDGKLLEKGASADVDEFDLGGLLVYRTLVLRRSPAGSRPPSVFQLVRRGRYYDVWQRPATGGPRILSHVSLGDRFHAAAVPPCRTVLDLARVAGRSGRLDAVLRSPNLAVELSGASAPERLGSYGEDSGAVYVRDAGTFAFSLRAPVAADYELGVDGSFGGHLELLVNGKRAGEARDALNWPSQYEPLGRARLEKGENRIELRYGGPDWRPTSGATSAFGLGPFVAGRVTGELPVVTVPASRARELCGRSLDWIEAIAG